MAKPYISYSYLNQAPKLVSYAGTSGQPVSSIYQKPAGQVLGVQAPTGSPVINNQVQPQSQQGTNNPPMEPTPDQPSVDPYEAAINEGISALDQYGQTLNPMYQQQLGEYEAQAGQQTREAQAERGSRLNQLASNRQETTTRGESAIAEARRMAAQLQQGIQSRYGGTTGTGAFTSEILGSQASQNIAANRGAMEQTLGQIYQAEEDVKTKTQNILTQINENLVSAKERARTGLQQALAEIASKKAELASSKAEMRMQALQNYQALVADINARNTAYKQQLYTAAQNAANQINSYKAQTQQTYNPDFQTFDFNVGDTQNKIVYDRNTGKQVLLRGSIAEKDEEEDWASYPTANQAPVAY